MPGSVSENLRKRHCDPALYGVTVDDDEGVATFPLWDLSGAMSGFQQYRPAANKEKNNHPKLGRYFTHRVKERLGLFGLETLNWSRPLFVQEGIFDAVRLHKFGIAAVATLSNDPKFLDEWLWLLRRPIYSFTDHGKAGAMMKKYTHKFWPCERDEDLGELSDSSIAYALKNYFHMETA